jgi:acyl-CoA thioesterase FadM
MARIKIDLPEKFSFSAIIPVRITDLNYAGHVGNDSILAIIHEVRVLFFVHYGYTELNLAGVGTIMSDVGIEFKRELFYGDVLKASVAAGEFSRVSFELFYKLEKITSDGKSIPVIYAKTEVVTYDYAKKKIVAVPDEVRLKFTGQ